MIQGAGRISTKFDIPSLLGERLAFKEQAMMS
jgi:hypothetical protein